MKTSSEDIHHSYAESHMETDARTYHEAFRTNAFRRIVWNWEMQVLRCEASRLFLQKSGACYLDFACGTGRVLACIEDFCDTSLGIDLSPKMLAVASRVARKSRIILGDILSEDILEPTSCDMITAFRFFAGAEDSLRLRVMRKLAEFLKPRGILIFNNHRNYASTTYVLQRAYFAMRRQDWNVRCMKDSEVASLCKSSGLFVSQVYHWGVVPAVENRMFLPPAIQARVESLLSRLPFLAALASNKIFVCRNNAV